MSHTTLQNQASTSINHPTGGRFNIYLQDSNNILAQHLLTCLARLSAVRVSESATKVAVLCPIYSILIGISRLLPDPGAVPCLICHHKVRSRIVLASSATASISGTAAARALASGVNADLCVVDVGAPKVHFADFDSHSVDGVRLTGAQACKRIRYLVCANSLYKDQFVSLLSCTRIHALSPIELHVNVAHLEDDRLGVASFIGVDKRSDLSSPGAGNGLYLARIPAE